MHESIYQDGHATRGHEIPYIQPDYPRQPTIHAKNPDTVTKVREQTTMDNNTKAKGISPWNNSIFDERWIATPEKMFATGARRTSVLTVSPDESSPSRYSPGFGENAALYTRLIAEHMDPTHDSSPNGKMDNTSLSGGEIPLPNTTHVRRTSNHTFSTASPSPPNLPGSATTKTSLKGERMESNRMRTTDW